MSEENVEIVRAAYDAFERGDLEGVSQLQAPTIEWQTSVEDPDAATHRGRVAVRRYIEGYMETFPGLRADLEECVEAPGDRVLATVRYTGRARASGMDMDWRQWLVYTLKDGLIVRCAEYFDRDQALEAAGLSYVDLLREGIDQWNRKDIPGMLRGMDPEIRWEHWLADLEGDLTGVDAVRAWHEDIARHFDHWRVDCDEFRDLGDRVLALGTLRAVGRESGVETEWPFTVVATFRNGLLTHFIDYGDRDRALEAAGLSE